MQEKITYNDLKEELLEDKIDVRDPTINVQNLLRAAVKRIDDLRDAETRRVDERSIYTSTHLELRINEEAAHTSEVMALRSSYEKQLAEKESARINAIREVDVAAVAIANERVTNQAAILATNQATSADALRTLATSTANTVAQQFQSTTQQLSDRLSTLETSSNIGRGKEQVSDPMMAAMVTELKTLTSSMTKTEVKQQVSDPMMVTMVAEIKALAVAVAKDKAKGEGASSLWLLIIGAVAFFGTLLQIVSMLSKLP